MSEPRQDMPRWAEELGEETWFDIVERLRRGWEVPDIMRDLELPREKLRSLQEFARKYGPMRRLYRYADFKDALLAAAPQWGKRFAAALELLAEQAVKPKVKESTQRKNVELMNECTKTLRRMMADEQEIESAKEAEKKPASGDLSKMMVDLLLSYGKDKEAAKLAAEQGVPLP